MELPFARSSFRYAADGPVVPIIQRARPLTGISLTALTPGTTACAGVMQLIDLRGFFHWTGIDNYEWNSGFDVQFGLPPRPRRAD
jgi:hypothetical protein